MALPRANWPQESGEYKIIQLEVDGLPYLRFNTRGEQYHNELLAAALEDFEIPFDTVELKGNKVPSPEGERYTLVGAGKAKVIADQRKVRFFGSSWGYDREISRQHLIRIQKEEKDWTLE